MMSSMILLGLATALGIVVDDAIVVRENIRRHLELGRDPRGAVRLAVAELRGPLTAATFACLPGFVALAFTGGISGPYFLPFAVTVAAATLLSSTLTLTLPPRGMRRAAVGWLARRLDRLAESYHDQLARALDHRGLVAAVSILLVVAAGVAIRRSPELLGPPGRPGALLLELRGPDSATLTGVARRVSEHVTGLAGVAGVALTGPVTVDGQEERVVGMSVRRKEPAPRLTPDDILASLDSVPLPPGYRIGEPGPAAERAALPGGLVAAMGTALVLAYLVLVLRFGSYRLPLAILVALPLAPLGAVVAIWLSGRTLTVPGLVGVLLVVGIAVRQATLLLACSVRRRDRGLNMRVAVIEAGRIRVRPVLLSTAALGLGSLPLLAFGGENGPAFGLAILGGVVSAALATLVVVPVMAEGLAGRERGKPAADTL